MKISYPKIIFSVLSLTIIGLLAFYLYQIGDLTRSSYLIKNHQLTADATIAQNSNLLGSSSNLLSLNTIEDKARAFGFIRVEKVNYIPITANLLTRINP